ncbi:hypothetical protein [Pyrococcus kukulkanii]|uniref:hypothetical protein n=1 Tax=Pyrococcus kukulkanii TaxID=1609559 RepID=UPI0035665413
MSRKVQIEVDEDLYNMLRIIALKKKVSLEETIKEALENYVELENRRIRGEVKKDSIWKIIGKGTLDQDASQDEAWGLAEWLENELE